MNDAPTPESDAAVCRYTGGEIVSFPKGLGNGVVPLDTARSIERRAVLAERKLAVARIALETIINNQP